MINAPNPNYHNLYATQNDSRKNVKVSFGSAGTPLYAVKNSNIVKTALPTVAFIGSIMAAFGYFVGGAGLFYDLSQEKKNKKKTFVPPPALTNYKYFYTQEKSKLIGVKTITPTTKVGKACMKITKVGIMASSLSGLS